MRLSFVFFLPPFACALLSVHRAHHHRLRRAPPSLLLPDSPSISPMSTLSLPTSIPSSIPSFSIPVPTTTITTSSSDPAQSTFTSSSALPISPSTTSTPPPPPSSVALPSSTPSSSAASTSTVTSTVSPTSAPVAVPQSQPSSSSTPITFPDGASALSQASSTSVVVLTTTIATPSSTSTQSSSSGFFSNTGAVAGTFTVVGLVSIAGVIAVALLIARRRHSRSYEEDTEYLDKSPGPPITQVTSLDDGSNSDHPHYGAPPMALATPAAAYYPDHAYAFHPQAFSPEAYPPPGPHSHPSPYPVTSTQDYAVQRIYSPEDYDIAYPPPTSRVGANMPNPHNFTDVELDSAPAPPTQTALPRALRPSVKSTLSVPKQQASPRISVDSFYAGIATDTPPTAGKAI